MTRRPTRRFVVTFSGPGDAETRQTRTAFLDRAVEHLRTGSVERVTHIRRSGELTLLAGGRVLLSGADKHAASKWLRDAEHAEVEIVTDARVAPPARPGPHLPPPPRRSPPPRGSNPRPPAPPAGEVRRSGYGRGSYGGATVLTPRVGRVAVDDADR